MKNVLVNAFSIQMLEDNSEVSFTKVNSADIPKDIMSAIGHQDTATVLSSILGVDIPMNRVSVHLDEETILYVAQLTGGRLPEGITTLPKGFNFVFWKVELKK